MHTKQRTGHRAASPERRRRRREHGKNRAFCRAILSLETKRTSGVKRYTALKKQTGQERQAE
jgi:hypothetical protein